MDNLLSLTASVLMPGPHRLERNKFLGVYIFKEIRYTQIIDIIDT